MKLLLAEDDPRNRDMLVRRLRRRGFEVLEAADGAAAIEGALNDAPALIIMDLAMPGLSGWEAIERIRAAGAHTPIIVLTAHSLSEERQRALQLGAQAYLTKPIDLDQLLAAITRLTDSGGTSTA